MSRIAHCDGCNALIYGVKSRIAMPHTCGKSHKEIWEMVEEKKEAMRFIRLSNKHITNETK